MNNKYKVLLKNFVYILIYFIISKKSSKKVKRKKDTLYNNINQFTIYTLILLLIHSIVEEEKYQRKTFLFSTVNALGPKCKCISYLDTYGKEYGTFTSPNWPSPYEDSIECILYTFQGESDQLVEITFDEFDLQRSNRE